MATTYFTLATNLCKELSHFATVQCTCIYITYFLARYRHRGIFHSYIHVCLFQEYFGPERKARMSLDVDIEGPVLLIPRHAFSPELMVGDIGCVKVTNATRYRGQSTGFGSTETAQFSQ